VVGDGRVRTNSRVFGRRIDLQRPAKERACLPGGRSGALARAMMISRGISFRFDAEWPTPASAANFALKVGRADLHLIPLRKAD
jgi:hypothetical protein